MATDGQGAGRIILVPRAADARPPAERPRRAVSEPPTPEPARSRERERGRRPPAQGHWTVRRLVNGAVLAGLATIAGGLVFAQNFQLFGDSNRQLLAVGFGLFVVGMVVLTLCLIGLAAAAVATIIAGQGMAAAIVLSLAPAIPLVALNKLGVLSYAFPALFVIIVAGGFTLALRR